MLCCKYKYNINSPTPCNKYLKNNRLKQTRLFYNYIDGESIYKDKITDKPLRFYVDFYEPVCEGCKTSTILLNDKGYQINDVILAKFLLPSEDTAKETDNCLPLLITNVETVNFANLTYVNAKNEGYSHVNLLKHELKNIYPQITDDTRCYIYQFAVLEFC